MGALKPSDYLHRINTVLPAVVNQPLNPVGLPSDEHRVIDSDVRVERQQHVKSFALIALMINPEEASLRLCQCDALIAAVDRISDQLLDEMYHACPDLLLKKEYPHLYIVLHDSSSSSFSKCVCYIKQQRNLFISLDGRYRSHEMGKQDRDFQPLVLLVATDHFIFIFDWRKLGSQLIHSIFQPLFDDHNVHIVAHNFDIREKIFWKKYGISFRNLYDIVDAERRLEKNLHLDPLNHYTIANMQQRYRRKSRMFETFARESFFYDLLENMKAPPPHRSVSKYSTQMLHHCIKQVVFLPKIKAVQMELFLKNARAETENALLDCWASAEEWAYCETDDSANNAPVCPNEDEDT